MASATTGKLPATDDDIPRGVDCDQLVGRLLGAVDQAITAVVLRIADVAADRDLRHQPVLGGIDDAEGLAMLLRDV